MIGIFDSGSGGLTVLKAIRDVLPSADVLYVGDIEHAPYGSRSRDELSLFTIRALEYLEKRGARSIVSACNSVSASLAVSLFDTLSIDASRIIEMVGPTVSFFKSSEARLGLVATPATIQSGIYDNAFRMIGKGCVSMPIEGLASAIEFDAGTGEIHALIRGALSTEFLDSIDVLILACTHYPIVTDIFREVVGDAIAIFDPADAVARRVERRLWPQEVGSGETVFVITAASSVFEGHIHRVCGSMPYTLEVVPGVCNR